MPTDQTPPFRLYVASRASIADRAAMWRNLRDRQHWPIVSSWIDGQPVDDEAQLERLWLRIHDELSRSAGLIFYAEEGDFPLTGAYVEVGIALGLGKPVAVVTPGVTVQAGSLRPVGSWMKHPLVKHCPSLEDARQWLRDQFWARAKAPRGYQADLVRVHALLDSASVLAQLSMEDQSFLHRAIDRGLASPRRVAKAYNISVETLVAFFVERGYSNPLEA